MTATSCMARITFAGLDARGIRGFWHQPPFVVHEASKCCSDVLALLYWMLVWLPNKISKD
ncbi:UNVERIFIED_CONTAM: hypothetical protein FKN15_027849 [Acipenser sinensis]